MSVHDALGIHFNLTTPECYLRLPSYNVYFFCDLSPAMMDEGKYFKVVPVITLPSTVFLCTLILEKKNRIHKQYTINNQVYSYLILGYAPGSNLK